MTLVVAIGLVHGLLVIPVLLSLFTTVWPTTVSSVRLAAPVYGSDDAASDACRRRTTRSSLLGRKTAAGVAPTVLAVNQ